MTIRAATPSDIQAIGQIAEAAGLFPAEYLPQMIAPGLEGGPDTWLVAESGQGIAGFAFARPEEMTDRAWNLLAIGVTEDTRGQGHATALLRAMETTLDARLILIDTTQRDEQAAARAFYEKEGYAHVATIKDYFADGEDKLTYLKAMA